MHARACASHTDQAELMSYLRGAWRRGWGPGWRGAGRWGGWTGWRGGRWFGAPVGAHRHLVPSHGPVCAAVGGAQDHATGADRPGLGVGDGGACIEGCLGGASEGGAGVGEVGGGCAADVHGVGNAGWAGGVRHTGASWAHLGVSSCRSRPGQSRCPGGHATGCRSCAWIARLMQSAKVQRLCQWRQGLSPLVVL